MCRLTRSGRVNLKEFGIARRLHGRCMRPMGYQENQGCHATGSRSGRHGLNRQNWKRVAKAKLLAEEERKEEKKKDLKKKKKAKRLADEEQAFKQLRMFKKCWSSALTAAFSGDDCNTAFWAWARHEGALPRLA